MKEPSISYDTDSDGRVRGRVIAANGEEVLKTEWYDNRSNLNRGLRDIARILLLELGEPDEEAEDA